jgi:hypothetical protein
MSELRAPPPKDRKPKKEKPAAEEAAEKMPDRHSEGGLCQRTVLVSMHTPQTADPSLRPAPAQTAGTAKARGTSLGMTARGFFRNL